MLFGHTDQHKILCRHQPLTIYPILLALLTLALIGRSSETTANNHQTTIIRIHADSAEQDQQLGLTRYRGQVRIIQGELQINADNATVIHSNTAVHGGVAAITAEGTPAYISLQTGQHGQTAIAASSNSLHYSLNRALLSLHGNASIDRDGSRVSGDKIEYFILDNRIQAVADPNGQQSRVHTIITPAATDRRSNNKDSKTSPTKGP